MDARVPEDEREKTLLWGWDRKLIRHIRSGDALPLARAIEKRLRTRAADQRQHADLYEAAAHGNRILLQDPDTAKMEYAYDELNRMTQVYSNNYSGTIASYEIDRGGRLIHETRGNSTVTYHGYDAMDREVLIQHRESNGTLIESWSYTRDEEGNPILVTRGSDLMRQYFEYDRANRIVKEAWRTNGGMNVYGFTYEYDAAGNRSRKTNLAGAHTYWNYDPADQMTIQKADAVTTVYFTYDANGNLAVEHDVDPSAGRTYYDYEARNLLTRVDFPQSVPTNYFYYNAVSERIRKDDSTGGKKYTWDGLIPVVEKDLTDATVQRMVKGYTRVDGIGDFAMQDVGGTVIYPHKNQVGTTMRHTDASEAMVNEYEYDAWGAEIEVSEGLSQAYRFAEKELDSETFRDKRYHLLLRFYLPGVGRFGQPDPLYFTLGGSAPGAMRGHLLRPKDWMNLYVYAMSQPTRRADPLGLQAPKLEDLLRGLGDKFKDCEESLCDAMGKFIDRLADASSDFDDFQEYSHWDGYFIQAEQFFEDKWKKANKGCDPKKSSSCCCDSGFKEWAKFNGTNNLRHFGGGLYYGRWVAQAQSALKDFPELLRSSAAGDYLRMRENFAEIEGNRQAAKASHDIETELDKHAPWYIEDEQSNYAWSMVRGMVGQQWRKRFCK